MNILFCQSQKLFYGNKKIIQLFKKICISKTPDFLKNFEQKFRRLSSQNACLNSNISKK